MNMQKNRQIIGTTETIDILDANVAGIPTKVDTGAYYSSIWASCIEEDGKNLSFILFDKDSPFYSGDVIKIKEFYKSKIRNSFGHGEERYRVKLNILLGDRNFKTDFTLANRSINKYPVLLGRSLLHNRFIVDVTKSNVHYNKTRQNQNS